MDELIDGSASSSEKAHNPNHLIGIGIVLWIVTKSFCVLVYSNVNSLFIDLEISHSYIFLLSETISMVLGLIFFFIILRRILFKKSIWIILRNLILTFLVIHLLQFLVGLWVASLLNRTHYENLNKYYLYLENNPYSQLIPIGFEVVFIVVLGLMLYTKKEGTVQVKAVSNLE